MQPGDSQQTHPTSVKAVTAAQSSEDESTKASATREINVGKSPNKGRINGKSCYVGKTGTGNLYIP